MNQMKESLHKVSTKISTLAGSTWSFILALIGVLVWVITGPYYHFSNTWLITISTITDVVIFLMVFSIQNTQNRDSKSIQLKLNELIIATKKARDTFIGLETLTDDELADLDDEFKKMVEGFEVKPAVQKLHKHIKAEKAKRTTIPQEAGHLVGSLIGSIVGENDEDEK